MKVRTNLTPVYKRSEQENAHSQLLRPDLIERCAWKCLIHQELCHHRTLQMVQGSPVCPQSRKVHSKVSKYKYFQLGSPEVLSLAVLAILFIYCLK